MERFRILHLSDTHFGEHPDRQTIIKVAKNPPYLSLARPGKNISLGLYPSSYSSDVAHGIATFMADVGSEIDLIIISGDLATTGRPADLGSAATFINAIPDRTSTAKGRPTIGAFADKILLCPGNHDRYKDNSGDPWCANFELQFSKYWRPNVPDIQFQTVLPNNDKIVIVSVDFCLRKSKDAQAPIRFNRYGRGKAYNDTISRLDIEMVSLKKKYPVSSFVWVIHFPPFEECKSYEKLIDYIDVVDLANKHQISLILSGHLHASSISKTKYGTPIFCAASACAADAAPDCRIHLLDMKIDDHNILDVRKTDYHWNGDDATFERVGPFVSVLGT